MDRAPKEVNPFEQVDDEDKLNFRAGFEAALAGGPIEKDDPNTAWLDGYREGTEWAKGHQGSLL
jgi:hypothetical protein